MITNDISLDMCMRKLIQKGSRSINGFFLTHSFASRLTSEISSVLLDFGFNRVSQVSVLNPNVILLQDSCICPVK